LALLLFEVLLDVGDEEEAADGDEESEEECVEI
jgi:hypothetical protein